MIGILETIVRYVLIFIDRVIYSFIPYVYNLLMEIAGTTIFSEDIISKFSSRIYGLLGIFMLFKVSFSLLNYIVNPDDFTDKNKGFSKIISNILITLVLLVVTPWIFNEAMDVQRILLRDNIAGKLILGTSGNSDIQNSGQTMAYETFRAFYYPDDKTFPECSDYNNDDGKNTTSSAEACVNSWGDVKDKEDVTQILINSAETKSVSLYLDHDLAAMKSGDDYVMKYIPIISTIAGGFVIAILISFCFDVAVRSIKLGFYQMLAPIPIISRLDPKKGKEIFGKWVKACLGTFLDLFVRLIAIYFSIFVITQILGTDSIQNTVTGASTKISFLAKAFIVMGSLLFAKELPKILEDLLGIKLSGKFEWNPLKKAASIPLAGAAAGALVGGIDSAYHKNGFWKGVKRNAGSIPIGGADNKVGPLGFFNTKDYQLRKDINKKRDTAQAAYEGEKEFGDIHNKWEAGDAAINSVMKKTGQTDMDSAFKSFDGVNRSPYESAYKNGEFINSLMNVDRATDEQKNAQKAYEIASAGNDGEARAKAWDNLDKSNKTLKGLEAVHDTNRKKYQGDADVQDALKFRKYNAADPTVSSPGTQNSSDVVSTSYNTTNSNASRSQSEADLVNVLSQVANQKKDK